jgi:hypothetical protein
MVISTRWPCPVADTENRDAGMLSVAPIFLIATVIVIALTIRKMVKAGERIDNLRAGFDAELAVGQELDQLMLKGARVFHDFPAENFNIDHVVVSSQGVFAVETKGYTKPGDLKGREGATVVLDDQVLKFPNWTTAEPLEQAERQAKWLTKWLTSAVGELVPESSFRLRRKARRHERHSLRTWIPESIAIAAGSAHSPLN